MEPEQHRTNVRAIELGRLGGLTRRERLTAEQRGTISRLAARARWPPDLVQAEREKAQEQAYLIQQILKNGRQLPLI